MSKKSTLASNSNLERNTSSRIDDPEMIILFGLARIELLFVNHSAFHSASTSNYLVEAMNQLDKITEWKTQVAAIREKAKKLFEGGTPGLQIASMICEGFDQFLIDLAAETLSQFPESEHAEIKKQGAMIAVGGTGRGDMAPYSDIDLLFLEENGASQSFSGFVNAYVQNCWDAKIQLGHSTRDVATCVALARQDPQITTPLVEARLLWGNEALYNRLVTQFKQRVLFSRRRKFIEDCIEAREEGWSEYGPPAQELEPNLKSSAGGLRDLHLIRWIGYGRYGVKDIDSLRLKGALTKEDAKSLKKAWEFLTKLRIDLHFSSGRAQDRLTKDEQLRIAEERNYQGSERQRPVEEFMQEYFYYSSEIATITRRFVAMERPRSMLEKTRDVVVGHRAEGMFYVGPDRIEVADRYLGKVCEDVESMLQFYKAAALYGVLPSPKVAEAIKKNLPESPEELSPRSAKAFNEIFKCKSALGPILRSMFQTGLIDLIIPHVTHIRNLLQFNQYHHFTVDEHTLRAIEIVTRFEEDDGPAGAAYREIRHQEVLHLAVLLHDIGKGLGGDHSEIGAEIAVTVCTRLRLPVYQIEQVSLLVKLHLLMADIAFRRDITDSELLVNFSRQIGSPDVLRMLYTLTIADVTAVGPGTWSSWKANLLTELFDRCLVILSGKRYVYDEQARIQETRVQVAKCLGERGGDSKSLDWVSMQLAGFSAYYLTCTPPEQIADDLEVIQRISEDRVEVIASWDAETGSMEYRVITADKTVQLGCFHKMAGVLSAKRLSILSADINTTANGVIIDSYRVVDPDYTGEPPRSRVVEIANSLRSILSGEISVEELFVKNSRFGAPAPAKSVSELPQLVKIDNDSSDSRSIFDIFAMDRPGLLYTLSKALFDMNVSIDMAKISTHFDQVIDVLYIQEHDGKRIRTAERIQEIKEGLQAALDDFDDNKHREFSKSTNFSEK